MSLSYNTISAVLSMLQADRFNRAAGTDIQLGGDVAELLCAGATTGRYTAEGLASWTVMQCGLLFVNNESVVKDLSSDELTLT